VDEAKALGRRVREVRCWRGLTLREAADLAGRSFSFWGQVERGEKPVANRATPEAMASALRVHPEQLPSAVMQAGFWAEVGRALAAEKKTRDKAVRVLMYAERLALQRIRHDIFVREAVAGLLRNARRDAGGRELRGLAWRLGVAPVR
jgi:transcriptional regulator with XRE-family HTH domain